MSVFNDYLVCIRCKTYNHSAFITDALNGFVMQQTDFPFIAVIVDDASTDGEQVVIKAYVDEHFDHSKETGYKQWETEDAYWTFARHKENGNCHFVVIYLKRNLYGNPQDKKKKDDLMKDWCNTKYIALCEGDDCWTDKNRLQKMVDFLESHPKYVLVTHRINRYYEATGEQEDDRSNDVYYGKKRGISFGRYYNRFIHWQTQTLRTMYRKDILDMAIQDFPYPKSDGILSCLVLKYGKGYGINECMGTYRIHSGGVWSRISDFDKYYGNMLMFRNFCHYEKSLFSKLSYYESYIDVYKRFPEELKNKESIKKNIVFLKIIHNLFLRVSSRYFEHKKKRL